MNRGFEVTDKMRQAWQRSFEGVVWGQFVVTSPAWRWLHEWGTCNVCT